MQFSSSRNTALLTLPASASTAPVNDATDARPEPKFCAANESLKPGEVTTVHITSPSNRQGAVTATITASVTNSNQICTGTYVNGQNAYVPSSSGLNCKATWIPTQNESPKVKEWPCAPVPQQLNVQYNYWTMTVVSENSNTLQLNRYVMTELENDHFGANFTAQGTYAFRGNLVGVCAGSGGCDFHLKATDYIEPSQTA